MGSETIYCEMCGAQIPKIRAKTVFVEGTVLWVCDQCYARLVKAKTPQLPMQSSRSSLSPAGVGRTVQRRVAMKSSTLSSSSVGTRRRTPQLERYELVEDFAQRIRSARERLGWSVSTLAEKVKESTTTIRRIESGKLRPTIDLARRLEEVLGIKLLVPAIEEETAGVESAYTSKYVTLGEIVAIRGKEKGNA